MNEELISYMDDIRTGITTFNEGKRASIKKWEKILELKNKLNWNSYLQSKIWSSCGLCYYRDYVFRNSNCDNCRLKGDCRSGWSYLDKGKPLYKIMTKISEHKKPSSIQLRKFIKVLKRLEE